MKIGIIGAGQIGGTLARRLTALGHEVFVANSRGPEKRTFISAVCTSALCHDQTLNDFRESFLANCATHTKAVIT